MEDEWKEPTAMQQAFHEAMRGPQKNKGNPPEVIDYNNLEIGEEITIENKNESV